MIKKQIFISSTKEFFTEVGEQLRWWTFIGLLTVGVTSVSFLINAEVTSTCREPLDIFFDSVFVVGKNYLYYISGLTFLTYVIFILICLFEKQIVNNKVSRVINKFYHFCLTQYYAKLYVRRTLNIIKFLFITTSIAAIGCLIYFIIFENFC